MRRLLSVAAAGGLSLRLVDSAALQEAFLPRLLPAAWRGRAAVAWDGEKPPAAWIALLWQKLQVLICMSHPSSPPPGADLVIYGKMFHGHACSVWSVSWGRALVSGGCLVARGVDFLGEDAGL